MESRLQPNASTEDGLELRVSLYYGGAEYKQKQKGTETKQAKPKLGETWKNNNKENKNLRHGTCSW